MPKADQVTHCYGPEPMRIVDRGMAEHLVTRKDGTTYVLRYRVGALQPMSTEGSKA